MYDLLLSVYQGEYDVCFKQVPLEQHMRQTFAPSDDEKHFFKALRDAVVSLQRCAATLSVVPSGVSEGGEDAEAKRSLKKKGILA